MQSHWLTGISYLNSPTRSGRRVAINCRFVLCKSCKGNGDTQGSICRAGTTILAVSLGLWLLTHLPLRGGYFPRIEESFAGKFGTGLAPVLKPLGLNWKVGVGLITSLIAREVIVGTLGTLYGIERPGESGNLATALHRDLTAGGAAALVVFFAFALQCFSTLVVVRRETGSWKWPALQFIYMGAFAYIAAWLTNHLVTAVFG